MTDGAHSNAKTQDHSGVGGGRWCCSVERGGKTFSFPRRGHLSSDW